MRLPIDTGRAKAAACRVNPPCARHRTGCGPSARSVVGPAAALAGFLCVTSPALSSTPATFDPRPEDLPQFTNELAARDPLAAEARCRSFLTALYHRLRTQGANPSWDPSEGQAEPLVWVMETYFTLPPASAGVRAAHAATGDMTRAYLDAFGPAAVPNSLPDDPLYLNDKAICEGVLGLVDD